MTKSAPSVEPSGAQPDAQSGAGSILVVGLIAVILAATILLVPLYSVLSAQTRVAAAADAAALAAADVAVGRLPGVPCVAAKAVAKINGASMTDCQLDGVIVTVRVRLFVVGFGVQSAATAGPPGG